MTEKRLPTLILPRFLLTRHVGSIIRDLFLLRPRKWQITPVIAGEAFADASLLAFRDSSSFRAGELHRHIDQSYFNRLITISLKYWTGFITLSTLTSFLPIIKEAIRESIITATDRLLAFLLIILLVRRLPSLFLILLSRD